MAEIPNLLLRLQNRPENVLLVRQALTGVAGCLALDAIETNDLNTAVTEACNNVVLHAYEGSEGALEVEAFVSTTTLVVLVRDHGIGMPSSLERESERDHGGGLGLAVIEALSRLVRFDETAGGGTEVRMEFAVPTTTLTEAFALDGGCLPVETAQEAQAPSDEALLSDNNVELKLVPGAIARAVLPRVLSVLAARAHFSTDRIADVQVVAEVLATKAGASIDGPHLDVGVRVAPRNLELRLGPLQTGHGESLLSAAADGLAPVIERLTDERHRIALAGEQGEALELRLVDQRR